MKKTLTGIAVLSALMLLFAGCTGLLGSGSNSLNNSTSGNNSGNSGSSGDSGSSGSSSSSSSGSAVVTDVISASQRVAAEEGKLGMYAKPYAAGDLLFSDGTATPVTKDMVLTQDQIDNAIAVIFFVGKGLNSDNTGTQESRTLGVGLRHSTSKMHWGESNANAKQIPIDPIKCTSKGSSGSYTFTGDRNGSDNLNQMKYFLQKYADGGVKDDTDNSALYPALYWAKNYGITCTEVKNTDYEAGWYLPSSAELYGISKYKDWIDTAGSKCSLSTFGENGRYYWSSSVTGNAGSAYYAYFTAKDTISYRGMSNNLHWCCAIREF